MLAPRFFKAASGKRDKASILNKILRDGFRVCASSSHRYGEARWGADRLTFVCEGRGEDGVPRLNNRVANLLTYPDAFWHAIFDLLDYPVTPRIII
ncbi:hypothetical protein PDR5_43520 [Pseudomonas sp. DR 5-09]|nr:hypothetical protein PDR5_43520 [Pseudomonas sp. DR 5-09]